MHYEPPLSRREGTHADLEPRSTCLCATPALSMSLSVRGLANLPLPDPEVHSRVLQAERPSCAPGGDLPSPLRLQSTEVWRREDDGRPGYPKRNPRPSARQSRDGPHDLEEGVASRCRDRSLCCRSTRLPRAQQSWKHTRQTLPPPTASSPRWWRNAGQGDVCVSGRLVCTLIIRLGECGSHAALLAVRQQGGGCARSMSGAGVLLSSNAKTLSSQLSRRVVVLVHACCTLSLLFTAAWLDGSPAVCVWEGDGESLKRLGPAGSRSRSKDWALRAAVIE